jgi:hypothetical protein
MRSIFLSLFLLQIWASLFAQTNPKAIYVKPHTKSNGTYVPGHYRTSPNSTNRDNFSTKPNVNPYTGKPGYINPDHKYSPKNYSAPNYNSNTSSSSTNINAVGMCHYSSCSNASRVLKSGDYGYNLRVYSNYCISHSPKCENPSCTNYASVSYSGFNKFCSEHSYTCKSSGCYNQSKTLKSGDYGYNLRMYSNYCISHSPKCKYPNCLKYAMISYSGFQSYCYDHK